MNWRVAAESGWRKMTYSMSSMSIAPSLLPATRRLGVDWSVSPGLGTRGCGEDETCGRPRRYRRLVLTRPAILDLSSQDHRVATIPGQIAGGAEVGLIWGPCRPSHVRIAS